MDTPIPVEIRSETTGKVAAGLYHELSAMGAAPGVSPLTPDNLLDVLAEKLAPRLRSEGGGGGGGGRRFLGNDLGGWMRILATTLLAGLVAFVAFQLALRDQVRERPTFLQLDERIQNQRAVHDEAANAHPPIRERLGGVEQHLGEIHESQIRQEEIGKAQFETLGTIREELRQLRPRR